MAMNLWRLLVLSFVLVGLLLSACGGAAQPATQVPTQAPARPPAQAPGSNLANPASTNCVNKGGQPQIMKRGDGGEYGVCVFDDNRQCEEWAMLRGDCPVGGVKLAGYVTQAAVYCVINGGRYDITANSGAADEQGTCTFKSGGICTAEALFNGKCRPAY